MKLKTGNDTKSVCSGISTLSTRSNRSRGFLRRFFSFRRRKKDDGSPTSLPIDERKDLMSSSKSSIKDEGDESLVDEEISHPLRKKSQSSRHSTVSTSLACPICFDTNQEQPEEWFLNCHPTPCVNCLVFYCHQQIDEGKLPTCMSCPEHIHPSDAKKILDSKYFEKYNEISVRHFLQRDRDTRWCPKPDCGFALIANDFASCPKISCQKKGCNTSFCYHCRGPWHADQSCDQARLASLIETEMNFSPWTSWNKIATSLTSRALKHSSDIRPCPRCGALISKMDDGSCNHITCRCGCEFCWLCLKEISDLHYLSPSGCTFWGKQIWSKKKIVFWQIGTLVLAPPMIGLMAGVAVPATIVGVPIWTGRQIRSELKKKSEISKGKRRALVGLGSTLAFILSPLVAGITVGVGVPVIMMYVYGVIPITLCRTGGCGIRVPGNRALRLLNRHDANNPTQHIQISEPVHRRAQQASTSLNPSISRWNETTSVNQSDDFSVSALEHGSPFPPHADISSVVALASFCSNSMSEYAVLHHVQDNHNSSSASAKVSSNKTTAAALSESAEVTNNSSSPSRQHSASSPTKNLNIHF